MQHYLEGSQAHLKNLMIVSCILLAGVIWGTIPNQAEAKKELFVSPSGSDNSKGTKNKPLKTISKAAKIAKKGTVVTIKKGTYPEHIVLKNSGTKKEPIIFQAEKPNTVKITGKKKGNQEQLILIDNKQYIQIKNIELTNFWTKKEDFTPIAIMVTGKSSHIRIEKTYIHDLGTKHKNGNAHGIAVYGNKPIKDITLVKNKLAHLKLGYSEAMVLNGDVSTFKITDNILTKNDNIGIDIIGGEGVSANKKTDKARNGSILRNNVSYQSSKHNPAYKGEQAAGGIYIDGGENVLIKGNTSHNNDIGIEVASEHKNKVAKDIRVLNNTVRQNNYTGIAVGGYDSSVGGIKNVVISGNILADNDKIGQEAGQLLIQSHITQLKVTNNKLYNKKAGFFISQGEKQKIKAVLSGNNYYLRTGDKFLSTWQGKRITSFSKFKKLTAETGKMIKRK